VTILFARVFQSEFLHSQSAGHESGYSRHRSSTPVEGEKKRRSLPKLLVTFIEHVFPAHLRHAYSSNLGKQYWTINIGVELLLDL
jgi:hypothetical protein